MTRPRHPPRVTTTQAPFGPLLRHWRRLRRLSQLDLALDAGVSARHLSFLETGRAAPSREMVRLLGTALALPLEAQNTLHIAAGYAAPFPVQDLDAAAFQHVRQALDFILRQQEPHPAMLLDGGWNIRLRNAAASRLFAPFQAAYAMEDQHRGNAMHVVFHPQGLRPFISNWAEFAGHLWLILLREAAQGGAQATRLLAEIQHYPGLPDRTAPAGTGPVATLKLSLGRLRLTFFSTFTTFAMPQDAALQQLKIEALYPADDATVEHVQTPDGEPNAHGDAPPARPERALHPQFRDQ